MSAWTSHYGLPEKCLRLLGKRTLRAMRACKSATCVNPVSSKKKFNEAIGIKDLNDKKTKNLKQLVYWKDSQFPHRKTSSVHAQWEHSWKNGRGKCIVCTSQFVQAKAAATCIFLYVYGCTPAHNVYNNVGRCSPPPKNSTLNNSHFFWRPGLGDSGWST